MRSAADVPSPDEVADVSRSNSVTLTRAGWRAVQQRRRLAVLADADRRVVLRGTPGVVFYSSVLVEYTNGTYSTWQYDVLDALPPC